MLIIILLDLFWSIAAFWVDWPKLFEIPLWAIPFAIICPIYPLLLAVVWFQIRRNGKPNSYLLAFAVIPSAVFGVLSIIFYPSLMIARGFAWNDIGQIFWVLFYSIQGWYLVLKNKISLLPALLVLLYLIIKFSLDYKFLTFGYLEAESLNSTVLLIVLIIAEVLASGLFYLAVKEKRPPTGRNVGSRERGRV